MSVHTYNNLTATLEIWHRARARGPSGMASYWVSPRIVGSLTPVVSSDLAPAERSTTPRRRARFGCIKQAGCKARKEILILTLFAARSATWRCGLHRLFWYSGSGLSDRRPSRARQLSCGACRMQYSLRSELIRRMWFRALALIPGPRPPLLSLVLEIPGRHAARSPTGRSDGPARFLLSPSG